MGGVKEARYPHNWWENGGEDTVKDWWKNGTSLPVDNGDSDHPNSAAWANQFNPPEILGRTLTGLQVDVHHRQPNHFIHRDRGRTPDRDTLRHLIRNHCFYWPTQVIQF